jgi:hypothetical protein
MEHLEDGGIFRVNQSSLARQYGVTPGMIRKDLAVISKHTRMENPGLILKKCDVALNIALQGAVETFQQARTTMEKIAAVRTISMVVRDYLDNLSKLGYMVDQTPDAQLFTIETFRTMILSQAKNNNQGIREILTQILNIDFKLDVNSINNFLQATEQRDTGTVVYDKVEWVNPVIKKEPPTQPVFPELPSSTPPTLEDDDDLEPIKPDEEEE